VVVVVVAVVIVVIVVVVVVIVTCQLQLDSQHQVLQGLPQIEEIVHLVSNTN